MKRYFIFEFVILALLISACSKKTIENTQSSTQSTEVVNSVVTQNSLKDSVHTITTQDNVIQLIFNDTAKVSIDLNTMQVSGKIKEAKVIQHAKTDQISTQKRDTIVSVAYSKKNVNTKQKTAEKQKTSLGWLYGIGIGFILAIFLWIIFKLRI